MIKKINVAGIELDNSTVRESILQLEASMGGGRFHTIQEITMNTIMRAEENDKVKEAIQRLSHSIIADVGILDAVGESSLQRKHEIVDRDFFFEFMRRLEKMQKTVFLLGRDVVATQAAHDYIMEEFPKMNVAGLEALENSPNQTESIINEINVVAPTVIISVIPSPEQELFMLENRDKLSAEVWYGIGAALEGQRGHRLLHFVQHAMGVRKLVKSISEYKKLEEV